MAERTEAVRVALSPLPAAGRPNAVGGDAGRALLERARGDELGLSPIAMRRHHHPTGEHVGHLRSVVLPHHVQAEVDPGCGARRRQHPSLVDVQDGAIDVDRREALGQHVREHPVGRRPPAVEQAGVREYEGARAQRRDARPSAMGAAEGAEQRLGRRLVDVAPRGHDHGVGAAQGREVVQPVDGEPGARTQRRRLGCAHREPVGRHAVRRAVDAEDLARHRQLEHRHLVERHNRDHLLAHGSILRVTASPANGRIVPKSVNPAARHPDGTRRGSDHVPASVRRRPARRAAPPSADRPRSRRTARPAQDARGQPTFAGGTGLAPILVGQPSSPHHRLTV